MRATTWRCALASALLAAPAAAARGPWLVSVSSTGFEACAQPASEVVCRQVAARAGEETSYEVGGLTGTARALPPGPLRFVVVADTGKGTEQQRAVARQLEKSPASLWLHMGDVVYDRGLDEEYDARHFEPYRRVLPRMALYPAVGNHDLGQHIIRRWLGARSLETYRRIHRKPPYYSFDAGPAHFVSLDVNAAYYRIRGAEEIGEGSAQDRWLREDLAASTAPWKIVFLHVPVRATDDHGDHEKLQRWLEPLFKRHGVQVVFQGHDHIYERTRPVDGTTYVTVGTGGAKLHGKGRHALADPFLFRLAAHGHLEVELDERSLRARFIDALGIERDRFAIGATD